MKHKLREAWCEECDGLSFVGGPVAVAGLIGVDRRTIYNRRTAGRVHVRLLSNDRWEVCGCSACGVPRGGKRCEQCRRFLGKIGENREVKVLDSPDEPPHDDP